MSASMRTVADAHADAAFPGSVDLTPAVYTPSNPSGTVPTLIQRSGGVMYLTKSGAVVPRAVNETLRDAIRALIRHEEELARAKKAAPALTSSDKEEKQVLVVPDRFSEEHEKMHSVFDGLLNAYDLRDVNCKLGSSVEDAVKHLFFDTLARVLIKSFDAGSSQSCCGALGCFGCVE